MTQEMNLDSELAETPGGYALGELLEELAASAKANADNPVPLATGSFALYPTPDGGVMFVTAVAEGPMAGTHKQHIRPGLIRAIAAVTGATKGSKVKALKGFLRRPKEIGQ